MIKTKTLTNLLLALVAFCGAILTSTKFANVQVDHFSTLAELPLDTGYPSEEVSRTLDEELFFQRACQTYLWALPAVNMYAMKEGLGKTFGEGYHVMSVFEKRLKPNTVITTPNSDVIYGLGFADLSRTGTLVVEAPPKLQALLDDFWGKAKGDKTKGGQLKGDRQGSCELCWHGSGGHSA